jgi:hypothetical protein
VGAVTGGREGGRESHEQDTIARVNTLFSVMTDRICLLLRDSNLAREGGSYMKQTQ